MTMRRVPFFLFTTGISSDDIRDVFLLFTTCRIAFILPPGVQQMVCDNDQSVSRQRAQFTRSRRSIPDGERCAQACSRPLLMIQGKCSRVRVKAAHISRSFPA